MRRTTLARGGALLTAAALALTLGAGTATADSTQTESGSIAPDTSSPDRAGTFPAPAAAKSGARAFRSGDVGITSAGDATIDDYSFKSAVMGSLRKDTEGNVIPFDFQTVYVPGRVTFNYFNGQKLGYRNGFPVAIAQMTVRDELIDNDSATLWPNRPSESAPGAEVPRRQGVGKFKLANELRVAVTPHDDALSDPFDWTPVFAKSNVFYIRRDTWGTFKARHSGRTVSFGARARLRATDGSAISAKTGYIQYSSNGSWKTLKTLSLDSTGNGTWSYKTSSKRTYRFLVKRSTVINGMTIKLPKL